MSATQLKVTFAAGLIVIAVYLGWPLIEGLAIRTIRFIDGQHFFGGRPMQTRSKEALPCVLVESERTLCCRMSYCDFRFPLPPGTRVARIDSVTGGFDTIKGVIYLTNANASTVDLHTYAKVMRRNGFSVDGDASVGLSASSPDGGYVGAQNYGQTCTLCFSFFGDY